MKKFEAERAAFFSKLMQQRIQDDYDDVPLTKPDTIHELVGSAIDYITYVETVIPTHEP